MNFKIIGLYLLPTLLMQYISANLISFKFILQPLINVLVINLCHTIINKFSSDQVQQTEEEDKNVKLIKWWAYFIVKLIFLNIGLEYLTSAWGNYKILNDFQRSSDLGNTSYQSFNNRCSAAYYYESKCEQLKARENWGSLKTLWRATDAGIIELDINENKATGQIIICSPSHTDKVKHIINKFGWNGPQPTQIEEKC